MNDYDNIRGLTKGIIISNDFKSHFGHFKPF